MTDAMFEMPSLNTKKLIIDLKYVEMKISKAGWLKVEA
jgi:hypothetical protein